MLIALDYDGTYTSDPPLWDRFIASARSSGHRVFIVTMRFPSEGAELRRSLPAKVDRIVFTSREAKARHLIRLGHDVHVWIDNHPELVLHDAPSATLLGVSRSARWKAALSRGFRALWPEKPTDDAAPPPVVASTRALPDLPTVAPNPAPHTPPVDGTATPARQSDRLVTVYGFRVWSESQGRYRISRFKAPRDVLEKYEVELLEATAETVPRSELDGRGRYLAPEQVPNDSSWRSSSFDLQSGLHVIEHPQSVP